MMRMLKRLAGPDPPLQPLGQPPFNLLIVLIHFFKIGVNPMNRSRSSSNFHFFIFFHCIFTPVVFGAADPFT
jgi:hypothetical protein